jgi:hypothetical protein
VPAGEGRTITTLTRYFAAPILAIVLAGSAARAGAPPKDGPHTEKWPNGKNKVVARYRGGQLDGPYAEYAENGRQILSCTYRGGKLHGKYEARTPAGKRKLQTQYQEGQLHGRHIEFKEDGFTPLKDQIYVKGQLLYARSVQMIEAELRRILGSARASGPVFTERPVTESGKHEAGKVSASHLGAALARMKAYRYLAGVPYEDVTLNERYNDEAQHAAVLLSVLGSLSHSPSKPIGVSDGFYKKAKAGCGSSNLAMGRGGLSGAVDMWMYDSDRRNIDRLGHRRWVINPSTKQVGFGTFGKFSAHWSLDRGRGKSTPDFDHVAYPCAGYQPMRFFKSGWAWCVSLNPKKYSAPVKGTAKATVRAAGFNFEKSPRPLELNYENVSNAGFGVRYCIIFRPKALAMAPGARYWVEISGIKTKAGKDAKLEYIVEFVP